MTNKEIAQKIIAQYESSKTWNLELAWIATSDDKAGRMIENFFGMMFKDRFLSVDENICLLHSAATA